MPKETVIGYKFISKKGNPQLLMIHAYQVAPKVHHGFTVHNKNDLMETKTTYRAVNNVNGIGNNVYCQTDETDGLFCPYPQHSYIGNEWSDEDNYYRIVGFEDISIPIQISQRGGKTRKVTNHKALVIMKRYKESIIEKYGKKYETLIRSYEKFYYVKGIGFVGNKVGNDNQNSKEKWVLKATDIDQQ